MASLLYFSDYINPIAKRIHFLIVVIIRFFVILFRWKKGIKLLHLNYEKKYHFDNSYLIIRYNFRNVLWYSFKKIKKTTARKPIVLNLKNLPELPIELTVFGFFRSKTFYISVIPENILQNCSFKVSIEGINEVEYISKQIVLKAMKPRPFLPKVKLNHLRIQVKQPSYNQTDFL